MRIEVLYPQLCCLYGDKGNTLFLQKCLPDAEFIFTQLNDKPLFLSEDIDLVCMYSMSEQSQELILSRLMQYKDEIKDKIENSKTFFLFLGNAMELLGNYIEREDETRVDALGIFDIYSLRHAPRRFNTLIQAKFNDITLLSYTSRFAETFGITEDMAMAKVEIGTGSCPDTKLEGICTDNLIATYMLGPILVANPDFSKWLLKKLGVNEPVLPFEDALYESYEAKRKEFQRPDLALD
jgi:CobQ-like glutamine amidotransferase family enzyme